MYDLIRELYPICRSITGQGVRQTLDLIGRHVPLEVSEVATGTQVLDWTVPKEWNVRAGWIRSLAGDTIVDFDDLNLHVLNYSTPIRQRIRRDELEPHLYTLPEHPDWVPYRTSYYAERWGFCLSEQQKARLTDDEYEICIDSTLSDGHLTYAECALPGETQDEIVLTAHVCHPSLCNDNLSGIAVAVYLLKELQRRATARLGVRVLFIPGTIGSISWLARNESHLPHVKHGLSLVCLGDTSPFTYKRSLIGDAEIDQVVEAALGESGRAGQAIDYFPYGYDERQFNSPGFAVPFGSLMRGQHGQFPEYHTSADNLEFVRPESLSESLSLCLDVVHTLQHNRRFRNLSPKGEPQLGKRGVYRALGGTDIGNAQLAIFWVLALSDGSRTLLDIAQRSRLSFTEIQAAAEVLESRGLLADR